MLIQEGHAFSVKASIHISFPAIVPRTLTIFPAYWSGCWYRSQRVASIGCVLARARLKAQKLRRKTETNTQDMIRLIVGSPVSAVALGDGSHFGWRSLDASRLIACLGRPSASSHSRACIPCRYCAGPGT